MAAHAKPNLSPSSFHRTAGCPGWGNFVKDIPRSGTNEYAAEGSVAHHLAELCINKGTDPCTYRGKIGWYNNGRCGIGNSDVAPEKEKGRHYRFTIEDDMIDAVTLYVNHIRKKRAAAAEGSEFKVEEKLSLEWITPGMFGTGDHVIVEPLGVLDVDDYKHGRGVTVEVGEKVGDNWQMSIYALGAIGPDNPNMVEYVRVTITQPRAPHHHGPIRSITYNVKDLYKWGQEVLKPAAEASEKPGAPLSAGSHCKWCPGLATCSEQRKTAAVVMFGDDKALENPPAEIKPADPTTLDGTRIDKILDIEPVLTDWLKSVRAEGHKRLMSNAADKPPGWKLIKGKLSNRAWKSDVDVYGQFKTVLPRDQVYVEKIASPAQIEKALKKAGPLTSSLKTTLADLLAERKPGKPLMVKTDDPRPVFQPVDEMFE